MKKFILTTIFAIVLVSISFADVLYLNEGEEIIGKLVSIETNKIEFSSLSGDKQVFEADEVAHILISKIRKGDEFQKISQIKDMVVKEALKNLPSQNAFPDADYVTLYRRCEFEFTSSEELVYTTRNIIQILKEPGLDEANNSIYYLSEREDGDLVFAHTYSPDGNVYHITDDAVSVEQLWSGTPEYSRLTRLKIALKKVDLGSVIDFSFTRKVRDINEIQPYTISYIFGEREPILREEFVVSFPETVELKKHLFQWNEELVKFEENKNDSKVNWIWRFSDPEGFIPEQNMLSTSRIFPKAVVFKEYSWEKSAKMLTEAYENARPEPESLQNFIDKLNLSDEMTNYEKVSTVYDFLNRDVRNLGMSISQMGSFKPVSTQTTLEKKYGNTQNILALMHFVLEKLNIESYPGFTTGKRENVTVKNFSSLGFTNYAVLKVIIDGHAFYTDSGSAYRPFATLNTGLQGSDACFIDLKNRCFNFESLPRQTFDWNKYDRIVMVKILENGDMEVQETIHFRGPFETGIRELKAIKDQEKRNYAERRVKRVHPNAVLRSFGFSDMNRLESPAVFALKYFIPEAAQKASSDIMTFTNFWVNYRSSSASLQKRKFPMQYWSSEENSNTIIFELPENFKWVSWNKQYNFASGNISFGSNMYQHSEQLVYTDRFIARDDEFLDDKTYQNYRRCILTMSELANQWIIIEREKTEEEPLKPVADKSEKTGQTEASDQQTTESTEE
jgi:hypothetical protein